MNTKRIFGLGAVLAAAVSLASAQPTTSAIVVTPNPQPNPTPYPPTPPASTLRADIWADQDVHYIGDSVDVSFRVNRDAYVYIFNTDARGVTTQIFPNYYDQDNYVRGGVTYTIPTRGYDLQVVGPAGRESLEIYAVTGYDRYETVFDDYNAQNPFPALNSQGQAALNSIIVAPPPTVQPNAVVVVPNPPQQSYDYARATAYMDVVDPYRQPAYGTGELVVHSSVRHVAVSVDGQFLGYGPATFAGLAPGYHNVEVYRPGYRTWRAQIYVQQGRGTTITVNLQRGNRPYQY